MTNVVGTPPTSLEPPPAAGSPEAAASATSNNSRPIPPANTGSAFLNVLANASTRFVQFERRFDPFFRPAFDALLQKPLTRLATALINAQRKNEGYKIAEEREIAGE